jgi:hypothetical protein
MILTPLNIQVAMLKAFYALAKKSVKYYTGLALGKNNTCLFKEMALLRVYIDILKNFEIVGSTTGCNCCIEGDYKVILPNDKTYYFQFSCDNTGYLVTEDDGGYDFTYCYDKTNNQLVMIFDVDYSYQSYFNFTAGAGETLYQVGLGSTIIYSNPNINYTDFIEDFNTTNTYGYFLTASGDITVVNKNGFFTNDNLVIGENDSNFSLKLEMIDTGPLIIKFENVDFTEECNFTYDGVFPWYYQSRLNVTGTPILTNNGLIAIKNPLGDDIVTPLVIPSSLLSDPKDVVDYWNLNRASTNFTLSYTNSRYIMESPADFVNYFSHTFNFTQYQIVNVPVPGINSTASATNTFVATGSERNKTISALVNGSVIGYYTIGVADLLDTAAQLAVKLENTFTYTGASSVTGATINLISPTASASYNGYIFRLEVDRIGFIRITGDGAAIGDTVSIVLDSDSQIIGQITVTNTATWVQDLVNNINLTNHLGIQANFFNFETLELFAPPLSGTSFNGETVTINATGSIIIQPSAPFNGGSASPTLINENPFAGGVNPTTNPTNQFFTYTSNFDIIVDDELTYENLNPCTPTTVTQTCLSNDDVKKVINNVNKIIK